MKTHIKTIHGNASLNRSGYYRITSRKEGNGGRLLHSVIWEEHYKKTVPKDYNIHHIDGNKQNNNINNLQCVKTSIHHRYHINKYNPMKEDIEAVKKAFMNRKKRKGKDIHNYRIDIPSGEELYNLNRSGELQKDLAKKYKCHVNLIERRISEYKKRNNISDNKTFRNDLPDNSYFRMLYYMFGISYPKISKLLKCSLRTSWRKVNL